jgi:manganese/zinc/iron transport system permease protein
MGSEFVALTLPPLIIATLAALACALPGNFLILRRQAMLGDAMAHVVLPGIVAAFLLTGSASTPVMLAGAMAAAALSSAMIEGIRRFAGVETGAAMGVTFTTMFAAGVLLLEMSHASGVHLDVEHALYGNLESLIWFDATGWASLLDPTALRGLPPQIAGLGMVTALVAGAVFLFWRPLTIATFDESFAATAGIPVKLLSAGLVGLTALAAVAAFSAVGSILTIAMLICPPATARLLTDDLRAQVVLSMVFATLSAIGGTLIAGYVPPLIGMPGTVSASGMIAVTSGLMLALATFAPRRGLTTPQA